MKFIMLKTVKYVCFEEAKSSSQKSTSKAEVATKDDDIELTSTTTANRKISSTEAATTSLVESSNPNPNMQTTKQSTPPTTKPIEYNRQQSVSFSDEAANQSIAQPGNNESSLHLHHHYHNHPHHHHHHHHQSPPQSSYHYGQRNVLVDQQVKEETSSDLDQLLQQQQQQKPAVNIQSAPVQSTNQLAVYTKQDSIRSAPPGADLLSVSGANNNYLQRPLEMSCLNSSFASSINTGIGLDSSYNNSPLLMNKSSLTIDPVLNTDNQHLPIRVLHKSMTKGSKV